MLGRGIGPLLADYLPFMPSGARRAGVARLMAARVGENTSALVNHPFLAQAVAGALGGALSALPGEGSSRAERVAIAAAPLVLVQALRRREMKKIHKKYNTEKRKRLRELDDEILSGSFLGGSHRLGTVGAYEAMRQRKFPTYGLASEIGDALAVSSQLGGLGALHVPVTSAIDNRRAEQLLRKKASWASEHNSPMIPLFLGSALLAGLGQRAAGKWVQRELSQGETIDDRRWPGLVRETSKGDPAGYRLPGYRNAHYEKPRSVEQALWALHQLRDAPEVESGKSFSGLNPKERHGKIQRLLREGLIAAGGGVDTPAIIAHEAGHARVENTPGFVRALQRHVYPHSGWMAPLAGVGAAGAGVLSGSPILGGLLGAGIGTLGSLGTVLPEAMASIHGIEGLKNYDGGALDSPEARKQLLSAFSTYAATGILPSVLAGIAGGAIGKARKKKKSEDDEQEKSAAFPDFLKALKHALEVAKHSPDMADRYLIGKGYSKLMPTLRGLPRNEDALAAGFTPGMKRNQILKWTMETLKNQRPVPQVPAPPPPLPAPPQNLIQGTFPF
jgi:hypothetical protein